MMDTATLELVCGHCGHWWLRYTVDLDLPYDQQCLTVDGRQYPFGRKMAPGVWQAESPVPYRATSQGSIPAVDSTRYRVTCPNACPSNVQVRLDKLENAAAKVMRHLYDTRMPLLCTTVDKLLKSAS
jgi:hypothetical protein